MGQQIMDVTLQIAIKVVAAQGALRQPLLVAAEQEVILKMVHSQSIGAAAIDLLRLQGGDYVQGTAGTGDRHVEPTFWLPVH